jgi:hypothetical protein
MHHLALTLMTMGMILQCGNSIFLAYDIIFQHVIARRDDASIKIAKLLQVDTDPGVKASSF